MTDFETHKKTIDRLIELRLTSTSIPGYSDEDLKQEGAIAALNALKYYDSERGELSKYLGSVIRNTFVILFKRTRAQKRGSEYAHIIDVNRVSGLSSEQPNPEELLINAERIAMIRRAIEAAKERLGDDENRVLNCYLDAPPIVNEMMLKHRNRGDRIIRPVIADYLDIPIRRVRVLISHIKKELRASLSRNDLLGEI